MKIFLRPISEKDGSLIVKWRNSEHVRNHCMSKAPITEESNREFYRNNVLTGKYIQFIVERVEEEFGSSSYPIATIYLKDIDMENRRCELCIFTSDDEEWMSESQSIAVKMLVEKAFTEYGMHKIYSYVFYKYSNEVDLLKNAGFSVEAILKEESIIDNDQYEDVIRLSVYNTKK